MRDRFGATNPRAQQLRFHTQTAGSTLTAQQPDNNIVRVALQALAAVLGGTQSLHCNGRDEALALPTEESARIALRTQQVIAAETGVANTVDPFGGAYAIEELTNRDRSRTRAALLDRIDAAGGTLAAIEAGLIQREIQESAYRAQQEIDARRARRRRRQPVRDRTSAPAIEVLADRSGDRARGRSSACARVRASRDAGELAGRARRASRPPRAAATNLVPPIIAAVEARATVGEISDTLRGVFGEHKEIDV